jgi:hypothetical protein
MIRRGVCVMGDFRHRLFWRGATLHVAGGVFLILIRFGYSKKGYLPQRTQQLRP